MEEKGFEKELTKKNNPYLIQSVITEIKIWINLIKKYFLFLVLLSIIGGGIGYYYASRSKPIFKADLKFVMKSDANSGASSLSALTSVLGGGGGSTGSPLERIIELVGSDKIVGSALLRSAKVDDKSDLLINHLIKLENLNTLWKGDSILSKAYFKPSVTFEDLNFAQRKAIKRVTKIVSGSEDLEGGIISKKFDKKSGIVTLTAKYINESFSIELTNAIYKELIDFYIDQTIFNTNSNVQILTKKVDSLKSVLTETQRNYAENTDQSLGLLLQKDKVESKGLFIKEQMLIVMYAEAQKNLETLRFIQSSTVPSFAIIDAPYSPIDPSRKKVKVYLILGMIITPLAFLYLLRLIYYLKKSIN